MIYLLNTNYHELATNFTTNFTKNEFMGNSWIIYGNSCSLKHKHELS